MLFGLINIKPKEEPRPDFSSIPTGMTETDNYVVVDEDIKELATVLSFSLPQLDKELVASIFDLKV